MIKSNHCYFYHILQNRSVSVSVSGASRDESLGTSFFWKLEPGNPHWDSNTCDGVLRKHGITKELIVLDLASPSILSCCRILVVASLTILVDYPKMTG